MEKPELRQIRTSLLELNTGQVEGLPKNPRFIRDGRYRKLKQSIEDAPEMLEMRSLIVMPRGSKYVTICGNMRLRACLELGYKELPCHVLPADTPAAKLREYTIKDNIGYGENDWDTLANEWDTAELEDWGLEIGGWETEDEGRQAEEDGSNAEYDAFVDKFKPKLTTDDCYTPPKVYEAVLRWVRENCGIEPEAEIMRPFKPGGDYLAEKYSGHSVVIDNPPFSIMSEILRNYGKMGVRFFLFAPHLTVFGNAPGTRIITGGNVTYENGAVVATAFVSNMFGDTACMTAPGLRLAIDEAQKNEDTPLPSYAYPDELVTSSRLGAIAKYTEFIIPRSHCVCVGALDSQKEQGRAIYGRGLLISELKAQELKAQELKAQELKAQELKAQELKAQELKAQELKARCRFDLSQRERDIIAQLGREETTEGKAAKAAKTQEEQRA